LCARKAAKVSVGFGVVFSGETDDGLRICAVDGGDLHAGDGVGGAGVGLLMLPEPIRPIGWSWDDAFRMLMIRDFLGGKRRGRLHHRVHRRRSAEGTEKTEAQSKGGFWRCLRC